MDIKKEQQLADAIDAYVENLSIEGLKEYVREHKTDFWFDAGYDHDEVDVDDFIEENKLIKPSSLSERKHENILDKLHHLEKFETPGSLERQIVVENALFEYIENNDFDFSDINGNHDGGWKFFRHESPNLRIHGRDLYTKVLMEAIDTYMAKNNIIDPTLSDAVSDIRSQYQHYKSLFTTDNGYAEAHKVQLNIDKNTDLAHNFLLSDVATKNVISDLSCDENAPIKLMKLLQENNKFSTAQIKYAGSELIDSITDFLDSDKGLSKDDVCKSIAESFYITHSEHFNPSYDSDSTKSLKP